MSLLRHHQLLMSSRNTGPETDFGQTLYWPMQESSGTTMFEQMTALNGSYVSGPLVAQAGYRSGYSSVRFDGANDYATVAHNIALNPGTSDYAVEYWAKIENDGALGVVFGKFALTGTFPGVLIFSNFRNNGFFDPYWITHRTENAAGYYQSTDVEADIAPTPPESWVHYFMQRKFESGQYRLKLYLNGVLRTNFLLTGSTNIVTSEPLYVMGRPASSQTTRGNMSNLRWYNNKSFTDIEVGAIYAARIS